MIRLRMVLATCMAMWMVVPPTAMAASHREAPITALDHSADITDVFAFVSYDSPDKVTLIMDTNGFSDPGNGPTWFPFDPDITYAFKVDNNNSALPAVTFEFRFTTEIRAPGVFNAFVGAGAGLKVPANGPSGAPAPGATIIPPAITALDGPGSEGLNLRQSYTVTMVTGSGASATRTNITGGNKLFAVPTNVGPRTTPNYPALARQGIYSLGNGIRTWAGSADDPFYLDLGPALDTLNFRPSAFPSGVPGVLTAAQDQGVTNQAPDILAGFNVNVIAIEVPIAMLTSDNQRHPATDQQATIGVFATTSRPRTTVRTISGDPPSPATDPTDTIQIQRMANPLINELLIGEGMKDKWSQSQPKDDAQFASFALDPLLARALNAATGGALTVPSPPRNDLLILMQYMPPIAAAGTPAGPVADLLRLNTGVPPTPVAARSRLAVLGGDLGGWPNGRRVSDDVIDIALRAVAGVLVPAFNKFPNNSLGDGVNSNDVPYQETFPYVGFAHSGYEIPSGGTITAPPGGGGPPPPPPPATIMAAVTNNGLTTTALQVVLDATASASPSGAITKYAFAVAQGSKVPAILQPAGSPMATIEFVSGPGEYDLTLTVTDAAGNVSAALPIKLFYQGK